MSKAEDRYLEHFQDGRLRDCSSKEAFLLAYRQAEKDLELTWEDVRELCGLSVVVELEKGRSLTDQEHYTEVLNRFNKLKEK